MCEITKMISETTDGWLVGHAKHKKQTQSHLWKMNLIIYSVRFNYIIKQKTGYKKVMRLCQGHL